MAREAVPNRMRVVHVISNLGLGGAETMLVRLVRQQAGTTPSHSVISFLPGGAYAETLRELGVQVIELEGRRSLRSAALLRPLGAALARARPRTSCRAGCTTATSLLPWRRWWDIVARPCSGASGRPWSGSATIGR